MVTQSVAQSVYTPDTFTTLARPTSYGSADRMAGPLPLIRANFRSNNLELSYALLHTNGVFSILVGDAATDLANGAQSIYDGDLALARAETLILPLFTNSNPAFFMLAEYTNLNLADITPPADGFPEDLALTDTAMHLLSSVPAVLQTNQALPICVATVDDLGETIPFNGPVQLSLTDSDGTPAAFDYQVMPNVLTLAKGFTTNQIVIQSGHDLGSVFLAGEINGSLTVTGARSARLESMMSLKEVLRYAEQDTWTPPVPDTTPIVGTFGEWPGHTAIHQGMDLGAPAHTPVLAARPGKVLAVMNNRPGIGTWLSIAHNLYVTRYLHLDPITNLNKGDLIKSKQVIGTIGDYKASMHIPVHLHFEILQAIGSGKTVAQNPALIIPELVSGDKDLPQITALYFRRENPAQITPVAKETEPISSGLSGAAYLVARIFGTDSRAPGSQHAPLAVVFTPESAEGESIWFDDSESLEQMATNVVLTTEDENGKTVKHHVFTPSKRVPGYTRLTDAEIKNNRKNQYQMWFPWNTALYQAQRQGPRSLSLMVADGTITNQTIKEFIFGPKILNKNGLAANAGDPINIQVQAKLGPLPQDTKGTTLDTMTLELDKSGLLTGGASLVDDPPAWAVAAHDESHTFTVTTTTDATGSLRIIARSAAFEDIADEVIISLESAKRYPLSVTTTGTGHGTVTKSPPDSPYAAGTEVTLTAKPDADSAFSGWSGDYLGANETIRIIMNSARQVTATFSTTNATNDSVAFRVTSAVCSLESVGGFGGIVDYTYKIIASGTAKGPVSAWMHVSAWLEEEQTSYTPDIINVPLWSHEEGFVTFFRGAGQPAETTWTASWEFVTTVFDGSAPPPTPYLIEGSVAITLPGGLSMAEDSMAVTCQ